MIGICAIVALASLTFEWWHYQRALIEGGSLVSKIVLFPTGVWDCSGPDCVLWTSQFDDGYHGGYSAAYWAIVGVIVLFASSGDARFGFTGSVPLFISLEVFVSGLHREISGTYQMTTTTLVTFGLSLGFWMLSAAGIFAIIISVVCAYSERMKKNMIPPPHLFFNRAPKSSKP